MKDQLFNLQKTQWLAQQFAPPFDRAGFVSDVMTRLPDLELKARMDWIAECLLAHLSPDFEQAIAQVRDALPPALDPERRDNDFGDFIIAPLGEWTVKAGLGRAPALALELLEDLTQRFSMEWALRPFLNHCPEMVWPVLERWSDHENYHVRRLVSEGTRPRLPWGIGISAPAERAVPLLTKLHGDPTRYVTRSISNHLNDLTKSNPALVINTLEDWAKQGQQDHAELAWMTRHALRSLVKTGDPRAMSILGYRSDLEVWSQITLHARRVRIDTKLTFDVEIHAPAKAPVMVDYVISFHRPNGRTARKVFKLKQASVPASGVLNLAKRHHFKGNATTFALYPGPHRIALQINGVCHAEEKFDLID